MSEQRLSKLQKWILVNCFRVTIQFDRSSLKALKNAGNWLRCKDCPKTREDVHPKKDIYDTRFKCKRGMRLVNECSYFAFYREDILLSFFSLTPDNGKLHNSRVQHFHNSPDYAKAQVTAYRSITGLVNKGLVNVYQFGGESMIINLTETGIAKAAELLKLEDFKSPVEP